MAFQRELTNQGKLGANVFGSQHQEKPPPSLKRANLGFPGGAVVENLPANAGDTGSSPGLGGSRMPRSN